MKKVCVVHLVRKKNKIESFERFIYSYKFFPSGMNHELLIIFKGFKNSQELNPYFNILQSINYKYFLISDIGFDVTVYLRAFQMFSVKYDFFLFFNSFSVILGKDWLRKFYNIGTLPNVGLVGASGSWQSHCLTSQLRFNKNINILNTAKFLFHPFFPIYIFKFYASKYFFPAFPNPHIRTNSFFISSKLLHKIKFRKILFKYQAYIFESGFKGLSRQIADMDKRLLIVGKNGKSYEMKNWDESKIFWQNNQENLLIADNQTRDYDSAALKRKKYLSNCAWGTKPSSNNFFPKVSVCIPVRNAGKFIHNAVVSVLNQSYKNYELIIIDNASSDDTNKWLEPFIGNKKIKYYKNKNNIGLVENFNMCLTKARGKYIKFLCADDFLAIDCLEKMVSALEANKSATIVTCAREIIDSNYRLLNIKRFSRLNNLFNGKDVINRCFFGANYIGEPSATMFRSKNVKGKFSVNLPHLVDLDFWFRLLECGDLINISQSLCVVRHHNLQLTKSNIKSDVLISDNIKLFNKYKEKSYIKHNFINILNRKIRMAYRVWMSRKYISNNRKNQILKLHSSFIFYYALNPMIILFMKIKFYIFTFIFSFLRKTKSYNI